MGLSPYHCLRVFRDVVGATPHQFLLRLRLAAAWRLVRTTSMTVTDVAGAVGFEDLSHVARSFTREFGMPPVRARGR